MNSIWIHQKKGTGSESTKTAPCPACSAFDGNTGYQEERSFHSPWEASLSTSSSPGQAGTGKAILLVLNTACQRESRHVACLACSFSQGNLARWFLHLPIRIGTSATAAKGHMLGKNSGVWRTVAPFNSSWALESGLQEKFILIIVRSDGANDRERKTHLPPVPSLYSCSSPTLQNALSSLKLSYYILNFISLAELTFPGATGEPWSSTSAVLNFYGFHFAMFIPQTVIT